MIHTLSSGVAMTRSNLFHALCLHLHQPPGSLLSLAGPTAEDGRRIVLCYERVARYAQKYAAVARLNVALSASLIEQFRDPAIVKAWAEIIDLPALAQAFRNAQSIDFITSSTRHSAFPPVPPAGWDDHFKRERLEMAEYLDRAPTGFRPPDGLFCATMVPSLVKAGYEYVVLSASALAGHPMDPFAAAWLSHGDDRIAIIPCDDSLSAAQANGLDAAWFADEVRRRATTADGPRLVTTWSDCENGEWFRAEGEGQGFFGGFFSPCMEFCETGEYPIRPIRLSEALRLAPPQHDVVLKTEHGPECWPTHHIPQPPARKTSTGAQKREKRRSTT
jgi:4-alpha-glucanotransferase